MFIAQDTFISDFGGSYLFVVDLMSLLTQNFTEETNSMEQSHS
jgi:hypothetical protein